MHMNKVALRLQQKFFDKPKHQYAPHFVANPPMHTSLEIKAMLDALKKFPKQAEIVDFGAGSGRITIPLLQKKFSVLSIDISDASLKSLQQVAKHLSLARPKISNTFPTDKTFAAIVGADVLHHINLDEYLPIFHKTLKKGGVAVFSEPCAFNISWYIFLPFASDWQVEKGIIQCTYFNLDKKFRKYGFSKVRIRGFGLLPTPLFTWSKKLCEINDRLGDLPFFKFFSYRYIIEVQK